MGGPYITILRVNINPQKLGNWKQSGFVTVPSGFRVYVFLRKISGFPFPSGFRDFEKWQDLMLQIFSNRTISHQEKIRIPCRPYNSDFVGTDFFCLHNVCIKSELCTLFSLFSQDKTIVIRWHKYCPFLHVLTPYSLWQHRWSTSM